MLVGSRARTWLIYTHELAGESSEDLLMAYGIDIRASNKNEAASH
jgi:hypothetical protein